MGPFIKDKNTTNKMTIHLLISLTPILIFAFIKNGIIPYQKGYTDIIGMFYPLIFVGISIISIFIFETLLELIKTKNIKKSLNQTYNIIYGILLGLILPINTPVTILILGTLVASIITKILSIIFKKNILNTALVASLFITTIFASTISTNGGYLNKYEINTMMTPLTNIAQEIENYETLVKPYGGLSKIFIGTIPGTIGETSAVLCIIALIYLIYFKIIKWRIPTTYILTVFAMTYVIGGSNNLGIWYPIFQIFSCGLIFKAVFIATDQKTSPVTPIGQILYGIFLGILTIVFRYILPLEQGIIISILIMNIAVTLLDKIGSLARFNFKIALIPFLISWVLILGLSIGIPMKYKNKMTSNSTEMIESIK